MSTSKRSRTPAYRAVFLVALMVLSTAVIGVGSVAANHTGTTVYVDASNSGAEDGSQTNPYNTNQEGVNHASAGDTVLVAAGTYAETVDIRKAIAVEADGDVTLRPGGTYGFLIRGGTQNATVRGFTIDGFAEPIRLDGRGGGITNVTIADNTITRSGGVAGIFAAFTQASSFENNAFVGGGTLQRGVFLHRSPNNVISDNSVTDVTAYGFDIDGESTDARVFNNSISNARISGIVVNYRSHRSVISGNSIDRSGYYGVDYRGSNQGTLTRNEISNSAQFGVSLYGSTGYTIYDNVFVNDRNVYPRTENTLNTWNVSPQAGPNVIGGPQIGGNFWSNPAGTGFSDTAADADFDGFADSAYIADGVNDEHPLVPDRDEPPAVTASAGVTTYQAGNGPTVVDSSLSASDNDGGNIDGARVVIQNPQPGDVLSFTAQHGITGSYDSSSGVLTLSGPASALEYQDVFQSVTFSNTLASPDPTDRRITFALGASIPFDGTGHFYEYVDAGTGITWHQANTGANAQTYFGLQGYLVTVTSQAENDFVAEKIQGNTWIGASDDTAFSYISKDTNGNDRWYWVTGPEAGTHFWTGDQQEAVNQPVSGEYANWEAGEPNDAGGDGNENYAHFWYTNTGRWNDLPGSTTNWVDGYVVEYGGLDSDPMLSLQDTKVVEVLVNTPPSISADAASVTVDEGSTATNGGAVSDAENDPVTLTASIGTVVDNGDGTWSWSYDTTDGPDDSQTVTITAMDDDAATASVSFDLTVNNVAPSVGADSISVTVDEGQTASNTGSYADPGDDTVTLSASAGTIVDNGDGTWSWSFDAIDGPADSKVVTITATDSDNAATQMMFNLTVDNVAPVLSADVDDSGVAGSPVSASGSFTDVGIADTHSVTIDWGDGTTSSAAVTQGAGSGSFTDSHAYAAGGYYDVTVTLADDDGGLDVYTETVTVAHLATIDVKPDSSENPVNPKAKGVLPVAILNTGDFDLTQVDVSSLRLSATEGGAGAATAHNGHFEDVDDDGDLDLLLHFVNQDIGLTDDTTAVYLSGFMTDGVPVVGSDMVDPVPVGNDDDDDAGTSGNGNGNGNGNGRGR